MNQKLGDAIRNRDLETHVEEVPFFENTVEIKPEDMHLNEDTLSMDVKFDIPADTPSTGTVDTTTDVFWKIQVETTHSRDDDFNAKFAIPIYASNIYDAKGHSKFEIHRRP